MPAVQNNFEERDATPIVGQDALYVNDLRLLVDDDLLLVGDARLEFDARGLGAPSPLLSSVEDDVEQRCTTAALADHAVQLLQATRMRLNKHLQQDSVFFLLVRVRGSVGRWARRFCDEAVQEFATTGLRLGDGLEPCSVRFLGNVVQ